MEEEDYKELDTRYDIPVGIIVALLVLSIPAFFISYNMQENKITDQLNECSFYTVAKPVRMPSTHTIYFKFYYQGIKYEDGTSVGAGDLGNSYTESSVMSSRYWVRVYCKDLNVNRIYWEAKVPDTLQYIPPKGWEEIPYGLDVKPRYW